MMHIPFIRRQLSRSSKQAAVFVLCVALSLTAITAFSGFSEGVNRSLLDDARRLHAADIIIRTGSPASDSLDREIVRLVSSGGVERAKFYEFYSVVRAVDKTASLLSSVKIVEEGYPLYGEVLLETGRPFREVLAAGRTVVEQTLLDRLGLRAGDGLYVGSQHLTIADTVTSEPDRPVNLFSFGPRVFVADVDRDRLGLMQKGSRVRHVNLLRVSDPSMVDGYAAMLRRAGRDGEERIDTFRTARSRVKRFLDNFLFFLKLVGFFILIVSGFGIQVTLAAFLSGKRPTIAIMRTMGATNRYITQHFMTIVSVLGTAGILLGLLAGYLVQNGLARVLASFLPADTQVAVSWAGVIEGIILGVAVVATFAFLPLYRLRETRPVMILRKDLTGSVKKWPFAVSILVLASFFVGLVFWHMADLRFGLYFLGGIAGLILLVLSVTELLLFMLRRRRIQHLVVRQAVKGLFRQGNATRSVVVTLTASLSVIFAIYLIEQNLDATFVRSYPPNAPNMFFLDIQPAQVEEFSGTIGPGVTIYPVVRARITAIDGETIDRREEGRKRGDNFSRVFNLTYRDHLLESETLETGPSLFRRDWEDVQVSILDMVVDMRPMGIGDRISFNIQGVPLTARVSSIRTQREESLSPYFYFVFQEKVLEDTPQTIFAAMRAAPERVSSLQNRIVSQFPNISVIDVSQTIQVFSKLMRQLSSVVRFFSFLSIGAGILILVSAVFATRAERVVESVYYRVLGAKKPFVFQVFALENVALGLLSSAVALAIAEAGGYLICRYTLDIPYHLFLHAALWMMVGATGLVVGVGALTSRSVLHEKPVVFLREQPDG